MDEQFGPDYDIDSATLKKFRRCARNGLSTLSRAERQNYAAAVEAAVHASQRAALRRAGSSLPRPNCASGTTHTTGEAIHKAIRDQQRAALLACPAQQRRARTPEQWREMYDAAMAEKRQREMLPKSSKRQRVEELIRASRERLAAA